MLRRAAGVTLLELLAVIAIVAILMAIGVPSYQYINNSYRISSEANGLLGDLEFARAEAIKEGQTVTACVSADGASCALNDSDWQDGWIVFSDIKDDQTVDTGDTVLRVERTFAGTDTFEAAPALGAVTFNREGFALDLPNGGDTLTLHDKTGSSTWARCLSITVVGMLSVQTHSTDPTGCT